MGPRSFKRGREADAKGLEHQLGASMGPRSFKRGRPPAAPTFPPSKIGFNGAALFQARKGGCGLPGGRLTAYASMGPRSFKRGRDDEIVLRIEHHQRFNGAALFQARKVPGLRLLRDASNSFNGAALFQARKGWGN